MLEIEIFSDVICPWCFIGKRRLDRVLDSPLGEDVTLRWRPYQLHPRLPLEGMDRDEYLARRYGADADRGRVPARIRAEAEAEGIELRFDLMKRLPNTLLAHRLLEYAHAAGCQHALADVLFVGYFCEGADVGDVDTLVGLAERVGLDGAAVRTFLLGSDATGEVHAQLARAPELGVSGVPGYYLANAFLLPGAQTDDVMAQIIERVKTRLADTA